MTQQTLLILAGTAIFFMGLMKIGARFSQKNSGFVFRGSLKQEIRGASMPAGAKDRIDVSGIAIALIGLLTAIVGLLK